MIQDESNKTTERVATRYNLQEAGFRWRKPLNNELVPGAETSLTLAKSLLTGAYVLPNKGSGSR